MKNHSHNLYILWVKRDLLERKAGFTLLAGAERNFQAWKISFHDWACALLVRITIGGMAR